MSNPEKKSVFDETEKEKLEKIAGLFDAIEGLYQSFGKEARTFIDDYHNEEGSLRHSIRWGQQACCDFSKE